MRIVIDLDGVICPVRQDKQNYVELEPLPGAVEKIKRLRESGHYIIIMTARHMRTCESNAGILMKKIGKLTLLVVKLKIIRGKDT